MGLPINDIFYDPKVKRIFKGLSKRITDNEACGLRPIVRANRTPYSNRGAPLFEDGLKLRQLVNRINYPHGFIPGQRELMFLSE